MRYVRTSGPLALAAVALAVFAGTASATTVTSSEGQTPSFAGEAAEGHVVFDNPIATINCASTEEVIVDNHGEGVDVEGEVGIFTLTGCTNSWHSTTIAKGRNKITAIGGGNATVFSSGRILDFTRFGITCKYKTSNTHMGVLTGGEHARLHLNGSIPFYTGSVLCGSSPMPMTGTFRYHRPTNVYFD